MIHVLVLHRWDMSAEVLLALLFIALQWQKLANFLRAEPKLFENRNFYIELKNCFSACWGNFSLTVICDFLWVLAGFKNLSGKGKWNYVFLQCISLWIILLSLSIWITSIQSELPLFIYMSFSWCLINLRLNVTKLCWFVCMCVCACVCVLVCVKYFVKHFSDIKVSCGMR